MRPLLIAGARLLDPASGLDRTGDLLVVDGRIAALDPAGMPDGTERLDAHGLCLAPGLVDMRVRLGEPGAEHKERFESGCAAAAAGGVTAMACLPDTSPPIDDPAMVEFVARRARRVRGTKVYPYAAVTKGLAGEQIAEMGLLRDAGAVAFSDAGRAVASARILRRALQYASALDALIVQLPEEPTLAYGGVMNAGPIASRLGLAGIPAMAEVIMIERDLRLVQMTGARYHAAPVTTAAAVAAIRQAKVQGLPVSCGTTPHHLTLNELEVEGYRTFAKVAPPLRSEVDRLAVIEGLLDGTIDVIASDHTPQDQDSKRLPFASAEFGVVGVETMLAVTLRLVHEGTIGLLRLLHAMTTAPARLLGIEGGSLTPGAPADLALIDLEAPWRITEAGLRSLSKNTAFEGRPVQGRVVRTLVDGRTVFTAAP
jgi:dihydroorotase